MTIPLTLTLRFLDDGARISVPSRSSGSGSAVVPRLPSVLGIVCTSYNLFFVFCSAVVISTQCQLTSLPLTLLLWPWRGMDRDHDRFTPPFCAMNLRLCTYHTDIRSFEVLLLLSTSTSLRVLATFRSPTSGSGSGSGWTRHRTPVGAS